MYIQCSSTLFCELRWLFANHKKNEKIEEKIPTNLSKYIFFYYKSLQCRRYRQYDFIHSSNKISTNKQTKYCQKWKRKWLFSRLTTEYSHDSWLLLRYSWKMEIFFWRENERNWHSIDWQIENIFIFYLIKTKQNAAS